MQLIPDDILANYEAALTTRTVPVSRYAEYRKWLRYYLVSEAHIRFRFLNRDRYVRSSSLVAGRAEREGVGNQRV